jgi:hypothetical protein
VVLLICECCNKPIERISDIKLTHRNGCQPEIAQKPEVISEPLRSEVAPEPVAETPKYKIFPDGRMTPKDAAVYTGYSASRLATLRSIGEGPKFIKRGLKVFYYQTALDAWMAQSGECVSTTQARFRQNSI